MAIGRKVQKEKASGLESYRVLVQRLKDTEIPKYWPQLKKVKRGNKVLISTLEGFAAENPENLGAFITALLEYAFEETKRMRIYDFKTDNQDLLEQLKDQRVLYGTTQGSYHTLNLSAKSLFQESIAGNVIIDGCTALLGLEKCEMGTPKGNVTVKNTIIQFSFLSHSKIHSNILLENCSTATGVLCLCEQVGSPNTHVMIKNTTVDHMPGILYRSKIFSELTLENCESKWILEDAAFAKDAPSLTLRNTPNVSQNVKFEPSDKSFTIYYDKKSGKPKFEEEPKREIIYEEIK